MLPYLVAAFIGVIVGLATLYAGVRYREFRKFLAGAFFLSSVMHVYFYVAKIPLPFLWIKADLPPWLSGVRGAIHFVLFLVFLYFGWFFRRGRGADGPTVDR